MNINIEVNKEWFEKNKQTFLEKYNQSDYVEKEDYNTTYKFTISNVENNENALSERERKEIFREREYLEGEQEQRKRGLVAVNKLLAL